MAGNIRTAFVNGEGSVRMPRIHSKGLRNKRKAYWASLRMAEQKAKERKAKAIERAEREERFGNTPFADY